MKKALRTFGLVLPLIVCQVLYAAPCSDVERELTYGRMALERATSTAGYLKSAKEFETAIQKSPHCAQAFFNLGVVYEKANAHELAKQAFEHYLELEPDAADAPQIQIKIYEFEYLMREENAKKETGWKRLNGDWCNAERCNSERYSITATNTGIEIKREKRMMGRGQGLAENYAIYRGSIDESGSIQGHWNEGKILLAHPSCTGADFKQEGTFSGEVRINNSSSPADDSISLTGRQLGSYVFDYEQCILRPASNDWYDVQVKLQRIQ